MANRIFHTQRTTNNGSVVLAGYFTLTSAGVSSTLTSAGRGVSCARQATGDFLFTLADKYTDITACSAGLEGTTNTAFSVQTISRVPGSSRVRVKLLTGSQGTAQFSLGSTTAAGTLSGTLMAIPASGLIPRAAKIASDTTITLHASNFIQVKLYCVYGSGTVTTVATFSGKTITLTGLRVGDMPLNSSASGELTSGRLLRYAILKQGSGHATPAGLMVQLQYANTEAKTATSGKLHYLIHCRNSSVK